MPIGFDMTRTASTVPSVAYAASSSTHTRAQRAGKVRRKSLYAIPSLSTRANFNDTGMSWTVGRPIVVDRVVTCMGGTPTSSRIDCIGRTSLIGFDAQPGDVHSHAGLRLDKEFFARPSRI